MVRGWSKPDSAVIERGKCRGHLEVAQWTSPLDIRLAKVEAASEASVRKVPVE